MMWTVATIVVILLVPAVFYGMHREGESVHREYYRRNALRKVK